MNDFVCTQNFEVKYGFEVSKVWFDTYQGATPTAPKIFDCTFVFDCI